MPSILVYTEDGRESVNSNKIPFLAKTLKKVSYKSSAIYNTKSFPLNAVDPASNPLKSARGNYDPYKDRLEEYKGVVFMKPAELGNGITCATQYATMPLNTYYSVADLTGTGNYNLDIVMADIDNVPRARGYINVCADDPQSTLLWSLETFRCGINVLHFSVFGQRLIEFDIPPWVNKNNLYVSVPHPLIYNRDNGTDDTWDVSEISFQILGNKALIRCDRATEAGVNRPPAPGGWIIFAEINKALYSENITS